MADMLNHYRPRETKWGFDDDVNGFTVTTLQGIAQGAQVYDSYGQKCNHRFLLNYGFSIENNVENGFCPNEVAFKFNLEDEDPLLKVKTKFWEQDNHSKVVRICAGLNDNLAFAFACLRVISGTCVGRVLLAHSLHAFR